jgi:hypothetical protein
MKTSVSKVITNHDLDSPFIEVNVVFRDDILLFFPENH